MKQLNETVAGTATDIRAKAAEIRQQGFCILPNHFSQKAIEACARAFRPILLDYAQTHSETPNRGPNRYYIPLPFQPPIFNPQFFFDPTILAIHEAVLGENTRIDQFASDTSFNGSVYQDVHADVPALFHEAPEMIHPPQILAMNFPLIRITPNHGPFEVARGSHLLLESEALKKNRSRRHFPRPPVAQHRRRSDSRYPLPAPGHTKPNRRATPGSRHQLHTHLVLPGKRA